MRQFIYLLIFSVLTFSCSTNSSRTNDEQEQNTLDSEQDDPSAYSDSRETEELDYGYSDGTYCAEVTYYNSNTGTNSSYTLTVEIESNELTQINWPSGGWMDNDHFGSKEIDENGYTNFTSEKGYDYEVQIIGDESGCFTDVPMAQQCIGITEDGDQCENMTDNENGLCWQHQDQE